MKMELQHLNLDEMLQNRPNSQRIFRMLREMQCYGIQGHAPSRLQHGEKTPGPGGVLAAEVRLQKP